jgi:hypothetical protein
MKRNPLRVVRRRSSDPTKNQWRRLAYDTKSIDGDIEALLDRLQQTQGCSRNVASEELVRKLSFAA